MKKVFVLATILSVAFPFISYAHSGHFQKDNGHRQKSAVVTPTPVQTLGETRFEAYNTLYASGDNTPAGSTQIDLGGHSGNAGGTGTYTDPITLATGGSVINGKEVDDYPYGTEFYIPAFRKYFIATDFCGDGASPQNEPCHKSERAGQTAARPICR